MVRILLDCSNIRLDGLPTGVPRVVANYINFGQEWAARHGHEFLLVIPRLDGLLPANSIVVSDRARSLINVPEPSGKEKAAYYIGLVTVYLVDRIRLLAFHATMTLGLILPVPHRQVERIANRMAGIMSAPARLLKSALDGWARRLVMLQPRPGDLLFCPAYWHDVDSRVYAKLKAQGCKINFLVHDILPITHQQHYPYPWRDEFKSRLLASFTFVDGYYCVSEETARSLTRFAGHFGKDQLSIAVNRNGLDPLQHSTKPVASPMIAKFIADHPQFVIMVGSIEPKKNHLYVIKEMHQLWEKDINIPLLIVGRRGWLDADIIDQIRHNRHFGKRLFWFDFVSDNDLHRLYQAARFLIFASEAEGFGLPIIEALSLGLPVLAYDTPICREVAGQFGIYFDRQCTHLSDVLAKLLTPAEYAKVRARVMSFEWPSWKEVTTELYKSLVRPVLRAVASAPDPQEAPQLTPTRQAVL